MAGLRVSIDYTTIPRCLGASINGIRPVWAKTSDAGRHAIAEAMLERIDVNGANDFTFTLTAHAKAHGWDAAFGAEDLQRSLSFLMVNATPREPPLPLELVRGA